MLGWLKPPKSFSSLMSTTNKGSALDDRSVYKLPTRSKVPTELSDCNLTPFKFADEHILKAPTPNFFEFRKPIRGDLAIL
jgi:hypothetical protein